MAAAGRICGSFSALRAKGQQPDSATDIVERHVRRLEVLRRASIVARVADGLWRVPADLVEKGKAYDHRSSPSANATENVLGDAKWPLLSAALMVHSFRCRYSWIFIGVASAMENSPSECSVLD
jgi:hypothetical protein